MPLAPTIFYDRLPSSSISSLHLKTGINKYLDDSPSTSSSTLNSYTSRRPPLPRTTVTQFQPRSLSNIALVRPSSTSFLSRSPSPISSHSSRLTSPSSSLSSRLSSQFQLRSSRFSKSPTPRRVFPQHTDNDDQLDMDEMSSKEQAPVVFDASLNFVLGIDKQKVRQSFKPTAAHQEPQTASSYLSTKISNFLQRTDHIMDEWKRIGRGGKDEANTSGDSSSPIKRNIHRTKSATNIMIKGYQYYSRSNSVCKSPSRNVRSPVTDDDKTTTSELEDEVVHALARGICDD